MNIQFFKKKNKLKHKKDGRINPHRFWVWFMITFLIVVIVEIISFTYFFVILSEKLDAPVEARFDSNSGQIEKIEKIIQKTEETVRAREGNPQPSQNETPIVQ